MTSSPSILNLARSSLAPKLAPPTLPTLLLRSSQRKLSTPSASELTTPQPPPSTEPLPVRPRTSSLPPPIPLHLQPSPTHRLVAAALLSRLPLILPAPTPFESAYYAYQRRLARALEKPLQTSFFFRPGSQAERTYTEERLAEEADPGTPVLTLRPDDPADHDARSLERRKDRTVYLLVKKNRSEAAWQLRTLACIFLLPFDIFSTGYGWRR